MSDTRATHLVEAQHVSWTFGLSRSGACSHIQLRGAWRLWSGCWGSESHGRAAERVFARLWRRWRVGLRRRRRARPRPRRLLSEELLQSALVLRDVGAGSRELRGRVHLWQALHLPFRVLGLLTRGLQNALRPRVPAILVRIGQAARRDLCRWLLGRPRAHGDPVRG